MEEGACSFALTSVRVLGRRKAEPRPDSFLDRILGPFGRTEVGLLRILGPVGRTEVGLWERTP